MIVKCKWWKRIIIIWKMMITKEKMQLNNIRMMIKLYQKIMILKILNLIYNTLLRNNKMKVLKMKNKKMIKLINKIS